MVRTLMRVGIGDKEYVEVFCLSTDTKPTTGIINGSELIEVDTGKTYLFNEVAGDWVEQPSGGGVEVESLSVTANSTYTAPEGKAYSPVTVNVPNSYAAGDEGKVVSNGALVAQTSNSVTENGTVDTTLINSLTVNVPQGGGGGDEIIARTISGTYTNGTITQIGIYAFYGCSSLEAASFSAVTTISSNAFVNCSRLTTVSFPSAVSVGQGAFMNCSRLTEANFPAATTLSSSAFNSCAMLTKANFPLATTIGSYAFYKCGSLTEANFSSATAIGSSAFMSCYSLATISFPLVKTIELGAFINCTSLAEASFPAATSIGGNAFSGCKRLISLYLLGSSVPSLPLLTAFNSTPIGGYSAVAGQYGSIFVPSSLYASYLTATNWSAFSSRFVSM